jgi:SNF2 family DNA or RNA helicase
MLDMLPEAKKIYDQHYQRFLSLFGIDSKSRFKQGEYFKQLSNLRMTCNHPLLFKEEGNLEDTTSINEMEETLGIMMPDERKRPADTRPAFRQDWILSYKLQYLVSQLENKKNLRKKDRSLKKTVIYSQWRCFMDW